MKKLIEQLGSLALKTPRSSSPSSLGPFPLGRDIPATRKVIVVEKPTEHEMMAIHNVKSVVHPVVISVLYDGSVEISYEDEQVGERLVNGLERTNVIFRRSSGI